jgi:hypothetical protein
MTDILGPLGTSILVLVLGLAVIAGAVFMGGRPSDIPKVSPRALMTGGLIMLFVLMLLAWRISQVPDGSGWMRP